jgi:carbamoyl-phosphate synthase large subunit
MTVLKDTFSSMTDYCKNIIIEGMGTSTTQNVLKSLEVLWDTNKNLSVIGLDMDERQAGRVIMKRRLGPRFNFVQCPSSKSSDFLPFVSEVLHKYTSHSSSCLYIPIIDYGFDSLSESFYSKRENYFPKNTFVVISPPETIDICDDKLRMSEFFKKMPRPFLLPKDNLDMAVEVSSIPKVIVKPRRGGRASLDIGFCEDIQGWKRESKRLGSNFFAQEFIEGQEVTVDILCDFRGKYLDSVCRKRLEVKAGVCHKAEVFKSSAYEEIAKFLCDKLEFIGPLNVQLIENNKGIYLIEINPRFSGGLSLSVAAGFNSPLCLYNMYVDWANNNNRFDDSKSYVVCERFVPCFAYKHSEVLIEPN